MLQQKHILDNLQLLTLQYSYVILDMKTNSDKSAAKFDWVQIMF